MMRIFQGISVAVVVVFAGVGVASATPTEPAPGSALRQELLDTIRPWAAFDLGAPIEFEVLEMMVDGDIAFARLMAQRPGGQEIDLAATPMVEWRYVDPYEVGGPRVEAFFLRRNGHWQITDYALGSSDAWWYGYRCEVFRSLLGEYGC